MQGPRYRRMSRMAAPVCQTPPPCTEPFRRAWLPTHPHLQLWDARSSPGSPCLQGGCVAGWAKYHVQQGAPICTSPLPSPWCWGWLGTQDDFGTRGCPSCSKVQQDEPHADLGMEARRSGDVSELEVLSHLQGGWGSGRVLGQGVESRSHWQGRQRHGGVSSKEQPWQDHGLGQNMAAFTQPGEVLCF